MCDWGSQHQARQKAGFETGIDIDHADIRRTTVEHAQQGSHASQVGAITDARGDRDHRAGHPARHG